MSVILLSEISKSNLESQKPSETWYIKYCLFVFPSENDVMIKVVMLN